MDSRTLSDNWQDVLDAKSGHIFAEDADEGCRFVILRGPCSVCAYVGIPATHPLAGMNYDQVPLNVHGGLTFSDKGDFLGLAGWWFYGWDYAHCGDFTVYDEKYGRGDDKKWTPKLVADDSMWSGWYAFQSLARLAQRLYEKGLLAAKQEKEPTCTA